jgi:hypothetical protein
VIGRRDVALGAVLVAVFCTAPTVGDVGGCGDDPVDVDAQTYAQQRKSVDCERCGECGVSTARCARSCQDGGPGEVSLPDSCKPLEHDVDVCLRALRAASCDTFASYVADVAPESPSECAFCRVARADAGPP